MSGGAVFRSGSRVARTFEQALMRDASEHWASRKSVIGNLRLCGSAESVLGCREAPASALSLHLTRGLNWNRHYEGDLGFGHVEAVACMVCPGRSRCRC